MTSTPKSANQNGVSHREEFQIGWGRDFSVPPYGGKSPLKAQTLFAQGVVNAAVLKQTTIYKKRSVMKPRSTIRPLFCSTDLTFLEPILRCEPSGLWSCIFQINRQLVAATEGGFSHLRNYLYPPTIIPDEHMPVSS